MRVFIDEDAGANLGRVLRLLGKDVEFVANSRSIRCGTRDEIWMPWAAGQNRLVLSRNTAILTTQAQHDLLVTEKLGFVFLPQIGKFEMARLILRKWEKLEELDARTTRPFAFKLRTGGTLIRQPLVSSDA